MPWNDAQPMQIAMKVGVEQRRPDIPHECPADLVSLITFCWAHRPTSRPSFQTIQLEVRNMREDALRESRTEAAILAVNRRRREEVEVNDQKKQQHAERKRGKERGQEQEQQGQEEVREVRDMEGERELEKRQRLEESSCPPAAAKSTAAAAASTRDDDGVVAPEKKRKKKGGNVVSRDEEKELLLPGRSDVLTREKRASARPDGDGEGSDINAEEEEVHDEIESRDIVIIDGDDHHDDMNKDDRHDVDDDTSPPTGEGTQQQDGTSPQTPVPASSSGTSSNKTWYRDRDRDRSSSSLNILEVTVDYLLSSLSNGSKSRTSKSSTSPRDEEEAAGGDVPKTSSK